MVLLLAMPSPGAGRDEILSVDVDLHPIPRSGTGRLNMHSILLDLRLGVQSQIDKGTRPEREPRSSNHMAAAGTSPGMAAAAPRLMKSVGLTSIVEMGNNYNKKKKQLAAAAMSSFVVEAMKMG